MGWLRRLFGSGAKKGPRSRAPAQPALSTYGRRITIKRIGEHFVMAREIDFGGQCVTSPNGRFKFLWRGDGHVNGEHVLGRYVLLDRDCVILDARMERPGDGKVADNGVFILNDSGPRGELSGTFHAFSSDGEEILSRQFSANLLNNGLSNDGRFAACQTCHSPGSPDSSILCVLDLAACQEVARWRPESGWADAYAFSDDGNRIRMLRRDREPIEYSLDGEFFDRRKWFADEVARGTYYVIKEALKAGEEVTGLNLAQLRAGANIAVGHLDERFRANTLRLLGEIEEQAGDLEAALAAYHQALAFDPKIGVAKRAAALRKALKLR